MSLKVEICLRDDSRSLDSAIKLVKKDQDITPLYRLCLVLFLCHRLLGFLSQRLSQATASLTFMNRKITFISPTGGYLIKRRLFVSMAEAA